MASEPATEFDSQIAELQNEGEVLEGQIAKLNDALKSHAAGTKRYCLIIKTVTILSQHKMKLQDKEDALMEKRAQFIRLNGIAGKIMYKGLMK